MKQVVIIGGGFGGLSVLEQLANDTDFSITLIDKNNYNFFPPLLYQVATGFLTPSDICYPYRKLLRKAKNCRYRMAELVKVIPENNRVQLSSGYIHYDYLIMAVGASTNYFNMEHVARYALPMKTLEDAVMIRNHLLLQMEMAITENELSVKEAYRTIVIAGGGPTGVEISGMLSDIVHYILPKDYPETIGSSVGKIYLVDGSDVLLKPMSDKSHTDVLNALTKMGVAVHLDTQVKDYDGNIVTLSNGSTIAAQTLIWAAGVSGNIFDGFPKDCFAKGNRLSVNEYNLVNGFDNIYAIGDCCSQTHEQDYRFGYPQMAQPAIQQGKLLGKNLQRMHAHKPLKPFAYRDKGSMAIIGRNKAVVDFPDNKFHLKGRIAWLMWLFVHLMALATVRNRITTFYNWLGMIFYKDQSLRMIIRKKN